MKIAVVNTLPIPSGEASVNRLLSYCKGLVECGNNVTILSSAIARSETCGMITGVPFYCFGSKGPVLFSLAKSLRSILLNIRRERYDVVILVSNSLLLIYPLTWVCHRLGIKIVQEKSEFPFVLMRSGLLNKIYARFYVSTTYRQFDGLICMTKPLVEYFSDKVKKGCQLFEMPMTVDVERFKIKKNEDSPLGQYIAYCGNMSGNKDGVENLIRSFSYIENQTEDIKLLLIGGANDTDGLEKIKELVRQLQLKRVVFYGRASRDEIPQLLKDAKLLALARPSSLQAKGGFPTKLGEYLATGNPVVVTAVGDIPLYLNEKNSFIVQPDDNIAFANKIEDILQDYDHALEIAAEGEKLAMTVFNSSYQALRLHDYLHSLL